MSPEQIAGKKVDGRSDLYSLGVMLFQMLTGVLPFRGDSMAELMYKIANEEAPDVRMMRKELPERLANVVALALSKRPDARYQDGDQFAADLRAVLAEMTGGVASSSAAARPAAALLAAVAVDATVVMAGPAASSATFEATVVGAASAASSYDPAQPGGPVGADPYEKTAVFNKPAASGKSESEA
jgi:serine/threonine-protein kinase